MWVSGAHSPRVQRLDRETGHSAPSTTKEKKKKRWSYTAAAARLKIGAEVMSMLAGGFAKSPQRKFDHRFALSGVENLREVGTEVEESVRIYWEAHCVQRGERKKIQFSCTKLS